MKIYNSISADKRYEFESKLENFEKTFNEYYDSKLFNPTISFNDSFIVIKQDETLICKVDLREDLKDYVLISESLLDDILNELNATHGLYVTTDIDKGYDYVVNNQELCEEIEQLFS